MSAITKHRSTAPRNLLLWLVLLTPLFGLATFMIATHNGVDTVTAWKITACVLGASWVASYITIRLVRWRKTNGPRSLPLG